MRLYAISGALVVLMLASVPLAGTSSLLAQAQPGGCRNGVWRLNTFNAGATEAASATSTSYCLFDGLVEMAEYRSFGPTGEVNFAGVSFHAWNEDRKGLTTLWLMIGDPGHTIIETRMDESGRWVSAGKGEDGGGKFEERSRVRFSPNRDYHFEMQRSYDGGKTWRPGANISGAFAGDSVPPLPNALQESYVRIKGGPASSSSTVVLSGLAEVRTESVIESGRTVRRIYFSSAYQQRGAVSPKAVWRTVVWRLGDSSVSVETGGK